MFDKVASNIKGVMSKLAGAIFIDKRLIEDICKKLKRALLEADVDIKLINHLLDKIKKKACIFNLTLSC